MLVWIPTRRKHLEAYKPYTRSLYQPILESSLQIAKSPSRCSLVMLSKSRCSLVKFKQMESCREQRFLDYHYNYQLCPEQTQPTSPQKPQLFHESEPWNCLENNRYPVTEPLQDLIPRQLTSDRMQKSDPQHPRLRMIKAQLCLSASCADDRAHFVAG